MEIEKVAAAIAEREKSLRTAQEKGEFLKVLNQEPVLASQPDYSSKIALTSEILERQMLRARGRLRPWSKPF